ncbi:MAG: CoF synthetase [Planctomycetes bacterium]|nr:CoF synthetase [Planctomycetota bacterium]
MKRLLIFAFLTVADRIRRLMMRWELAFGLLFLPGMGHVWERVGLWKAWYALERAKRNCPAYADFLAKNPGARVTLRGWTPDFTAIPPMNKANYILAYSIEQRCVGGTLPMKGAVIDESSGSTGTPNNWVRGPGERRYVARMLQIAMHATLKDKPRLFINAFALGPWATGMCVSNAVVDICLLKSTGPDIGKIVNTLKAFGPGYQYVLAGYPPFLKMLVDAPGIDWAGFHITAFFGGEAISENMRTYLMKAFRGGVYGDYGASDLEINIAAENDFTIAVRRLMIENPGVRRRLNGRFGDAIPSVLQYNPLDYLIETSGEGELLFTISRLTNVSPRIRYNIHDLGRTITFRETKAFLEAEGVDVSRLPTPLVELPLILMYGRSDFSVAFYGCKITPGEVEGILYGTPDLARIINAFALVTSEGPDTSKRLAVCLELAAEACAPGAEETDALRDKVFARLAEVNQDFRESIRMVPAGHHPTIEFHEKAKGPFAANDIRVKCRYIQQQGPSKSVALAAGTT